MCRLSYTPAGAPPGGPGAQPFGEDNVWIDSGKLHLKVAQDGGSWKNAQVYMCASGGCNATDWKSGVAAQESVSYGVFSWLVESVGVATITGAAQGGNADTAEDPQAVLGFDSNLVLGLYIYKAK